MIKPIIFSQNIADQNSYLYAYKNEAFVVDPGFNGEAILGRIAEKGFHLSYVLITHAHYDHLRDVKILQEKHEFTLIIHEMDYPGLFETGLNYAKSFNGSFQLKPTQVVRKVKDEDEIIFGASKIRVIHTPGHTVGGACFLFDQMLFSGDTLFRQGIGRTDLAGGSQKAMRDSLAKLFGMLSNEVKVYPGHDEMTSIGEEREHSPYVQNGKKR